MLSLGLMAKPMLVTVPVVLLLLDYWPLGRLRAMATGNAASGRRSAPLDPGEGPAARPGGRPRSWSRSSPSATRSSRSSNCLDTRPHRQCADARTSPISATCLTRLDSRCFGPASHSDPVAASRWRSGSSRCITSGRSGCATTGPYVLVGWLWYVVMLVPVIGIVQVGIPGARRSLHVPAADRDRLALTWAAADAARAWRHGQAVLMATAGSAIVVLVLCARAQTSSWRSSESLWTHALAHTSRNALAHGNLGAALMDSGRAEEAMPHLRAALALIPHYPEARANLGNALLAKGHVHEGMAHYRRALKVDPGHANAALGLANALARLGRGEDAIATLPAGDRQCPRQRDRTQQSRQRAARRRPGRRGTAAVPDRAGRSIRSSRWRRTTSPARCYRPAHWTRRWPTTVARSRSTRATRRHTTTSGSRSSGPAAGQEAMASYRTALALRPDYPDAHNDLAVACMATGVWTRPSRTIARRWRVSRNRS